MTYAEWKAAVTAAHARAARVTSMLMDRARQTATDAGLDGSIVGTHVHNALGAAQVGRPWRGVDYGKVRLANRLMQQSYRPQELADAYASRTLSQVVYPRS